MVRCSLAQFRKAIARASIAEKCEHLRSPEPRLFNGLDKRHFFALQNSRDHPSLAPPSAATMSRTILSLPLRTASQLNQQSLLWTCRRCLATQSRSDSNQPEFSPSLPSDQRRDAHGKVVPLQRRDWLLKKQLPHDIPRTRLVHSTTDILPDKEKAQRDAIPKHKRTVGVVTSAGLMDRTVTVRLPGQAWNKHIKKVGEAANDAKTR
jgi:hypothetical protein